MIDVFGEDYTDIYDLAYATKDYALEVERIVQAFEHHAPGQVHRVLDLGCGTGSHAIPLAGRGFDVVGVDRSEPMLEHARRKSREAPSGTGPIRFEQGDVRTAVLDGPFDAALMMFAVLGYQIGNDDLELALRNVRRHLRPGGLFLFDVWYGPAVLSERPSTRYRVFDSDAGRVIRIAESQLDLRRHVCDVTFHVFRLGPGVEPIEDSEVHPVRFFFPMELEFVLKTCGLRLLEMGAFPELTEPLTQDTWNAIVLAQAE